MPALLQRLANGTFNDGWQNGTAFGSQPIVRAGRIDGDYECSTTIAFKLNGKGHWTLRERLHVRGARPNSPTIRHGFDNNATTSLLCDCHVISLTSIKFRDAYYGGRVMHQ
jgi:hypothetical protein